ncbi:hypothetical protein SteCoe_2577 [Stentor coeruleus]|uniref:Uncharacterized protein n=1 Tax=Stentor coeruleus TaxID=5963 RepID=A0A1R2CZ12_9CILI|nr:hypothetical protein SteCoe_2577 [Stentor coeruleus]
MYILDTTAIIALVSELTYNIDSIPYIPFPRRTYLTQQISDELSSPGSLLSKLHSFTPYYVLLNSIKITEEIISKIAGPQEKLRYSQLKNSFIIIENYSTDENFSIVTANKKLKKKFPNHVFIYHAPRSLLGL